jgi:hypothetical protein
VKLDELSKLCDLLRKKGIVEFKGTTEEFGPLELRLSSAVGEVVPESPEAQADEVKKEFRKMLTSKPRGRDGLTADEQEDLYGQVVDEIPDKEG